MHKTIYSSHWISWCSYTKNYSHSRFSLRQKNWIYRVQAEVNVIYFLMMTSNQCSMSDLPLKSQRLTAELSCQQGVEREGEEGKDSASSFFSPFSSKNSRASWLHRTTFPGQQCSFTAFRSCRGRGVGDQGVKCYYHPRSVSPQTLSQSKFRVFKMSFSICLMMRNLFVFNLFVLQYFNTINTQNVQL